MTLREWLDVYTHNGDAQLVCAWRKRAWRAMRPVVERFVASNDAGLPVSALALCGDIELAGEAAGIKRSSKRWSQERVRLTTILQNEPVWWPTPTQDEIDVTMVARDLAEMGEIDRARALLREQSPNVCNRRCPACGRKPGEPCRDLVTDADLVAPHESRVTA